MALTGRQEASLVLGLHPLCWATQGKSLTLSESSKGNMVLTNTEGFCVQEKEFAAQYTGRGRLLGAQAPAADTLCVLSSENFLFRIWFFLALASEPPGSLKNLIPRHHFRAIESESRGVSPETLLSKLPGDGSQRPATGAPPSAFTNPWMGSSVWLQML